MKFSLFIFFFLIALPAIAAETSSGLPIPRWVSLKSRTGEVNARSGPGTNYPIKWVYTENSLPVEVIAEFGNWRRIRDKGGEDGWVLQSLLSGKRTAITTGDIVAYGNHLGDRAVMRLGPNVLVTMKECRATQCEVIHKEITGWADRTKLWGLYEKELFD